MTGFNPWLRNGGPHIPGWLFVREEVSAAARLLYAVLAEEAQDEDGVFGPDTEHYIGVLAFGCLVELKDHKLIEFTGPAVEGQSVSFSFLHHEWMTAPLEEGEVA